MFGGKQVKAKKQRERMIQDEDIHNQKMAPNYSGISIEKRNNRSHAAQYGKEPVIKEADNPRSGAGIYILPDARKEKGKEK